MIGQRSALFLILALAAGVRVASYVQLADGPLLELHRWNESDMSFYDRWAQEVAAGDLLTNTRMRPYHSGHVAVARQAHALSGSGEPFDAAVGERIWDGWLGEKSFYQDPLYPYVLAGIYRVFGRRVGAVVFVQGVLGLASIAMVVWLARVMAGGSVAVVAGLLAALFGPLVFYESLLLRPVLIAATGLAAVCAFVRAAHDTADVRRLLAAGLLSGVAVLAQSSALRFLAVAAAVLVPRFRRDGAPLLRPLGAGLLGFALALAPAVARNLAVGQPAFVLSATGGWTFLNHNAGDYDPSGGDTVSRHAGVVMSRAGGRLLPTVAEALKTHASLGSWPALLSGKLLAFWHWYEVPNNANYYMYRLETPALGWLAIPFSVIAPLAAVGLLLAPRSSAVFSLLVAYMASGIATIVVFYNLSRFRLPIAMAMIPLAASGAVALVRLWRVGAWRRCAAAAAVGLVLGAVLWRPLPQGRAVLRVADYGVPNEIALGLARQRAEARDLAGALRLIERQIVLEPEDLREAEPQPGATRLAVLSAAVSGSFAKLHAMAAALAGELGRLERARGHQRRAQILNVVAAQYERAEKQAVGARE